TADAVSTLSGGNQQKVVLAKWLANDPKILLLDEPTRGVDVGAKAEIYALLRGLSEKGLALLIVSSELPELITLSDRILVMSKHRIAGEVARADF
ncbi:ATP-binding cassette domain-containing protein, partial [Salmonella enterica]